jgi:hypothetical protein
MRPTTLLTTRGGMDVAGLQPFHISANTSPSGEITIQDDAYHFIQWLNTTGAYGVSRWDYGRHIDRGSSTTTAVGSWWAEPGWREVYAHDAAGVATAGSAAALVTAIAAGQDVRVQVGSGVFHGCAGVEESAGSATCYVRDHIGWTETMRGAEHTLPNVYREHRQVRSNGRVHTERYSIGTATRLLSRTDMTAARWYVNDLGWRTTLRTDAAGAAVEGSVAALIDAAVAGADVTVVSDFGTGHVSNPCDTIRFDRAGGRLGCIYSLSAIDRPGGATGYWYYAVLNTNGVVRDDRICFGSTASCGGSSTSRPSGGMTWLTR